MCRTAGPCTLPPAPDDRGLRWRQARPIHPVKPSWPPAMRGHTGTCKVRLEIDEEGVPSHVILEDCPLEWAGPVVEACFDTRFRPYTIEGEPHPSQFVYLFKFKTR